MPRQMKKDKNKPFRGDGNLEGSNLVV